MRFYFTREPIKHIKSSFFFNDALVIIDLKKIADEYVGVTDKKCYDFFVAEEISGTIVKTLKKKKNNSIIYVNDNLSVDVIENVKKIVTDNEKVYTFIFIDKEQNLNYELYYLFDEIIIFPKLRKEKIVECEKFSSPLFYWVNDLKMK